MEDTKTFSDDTPQGEVLISSTSIGKVFCRDLRKSLWYGIQDSSKDLFPVFTRNKTPQLRPQEFWANRDISFEVRRGECLGLIGSNGAGKTTLLKMLTGLIKPDQGAIRMRGRIGALIALGAGFNPVLTGRENIYVYGSILGLSRLEIRKRLEEVIEFADISNAIDAPVRTYSSGMQVRLGFATAVVLLEPDILILDEVLAVGDVAFRVKCYNAVDRLRAKAAVILVSHSEEHICRVTDRVLLLEKGRVSFIGDTARGMVEYRKQQANYLQAKDNSRTAVSVLHPITSIEGTDSTTTINAGAPLQLQATLFLETHTELTFRLVLVTEFKSVAAEMHHTTPHKLHAGANRVSVSIAKLEVRAGKYSLHMNCFNNVGHVLGSAVIGEIEVCGSGLGETHYQPESNLSCSIATTEP